MLRLIGYEDFAISVAFLRSMAYEAQVSQWGPHRAQRLRVHLRDDIQTGEQMRSAIEEPCTVSLISGHAGWEHDACWLSSGTGKKAATLNISTIGRIGATSAVILDACYPHDVLPELAAHAGRDAVLIGINVKPEPGTTDGRMAVTVLADIVRELCHPRDQQGLAPAAVLNAAERVEERVRARNRLSQPGDRTAGVLVYHQGSFTSAIPKSNNDYPM